MTADARPACHDTSRGTQTRAAPPPRLIDGPRYGFEPHRDFQVPTRIGLVDREREPVIGAVLAYLRDCAAVRRRRIGDDGPLPGLALASPPESEVPRFPSELHCPAIDLNRCLL